MGAMSLRLCANDSTYAVIQAEANSCSVTNPPTIVRLNCTSTQRSKVIISRDISKICSIY
jgi:hypothetical protein